jgi:hypothetical protein
MADSNLGLQLDAAGRERKLFRGELVAALRCFGVCDAPRSHCDRAAFIFAFAPVERCKGGRGSGSLSGLFMISNCRRIKEMGMLRTGLVGAWQKVPVFR